MITPGDQRFGGVSQADETRGKRPKRANHAIKQRDGPFQAAPVSLERVWRATARPIAAIRRGVNRNEQPGPEQAIPPISQTSTSSRGEISA
jgi:hypothetical protein